MASSSPMTRLFDEQLVIIPKPPSRFTVNEWHLTNRVRTRICLAQQKLTDSLLEEVDRIEEQVVEEAKLNKKDVDRSLQQKIDLIEFVKKEIRLQRNDVCVEIDNLLTYNERIMDAMAALKDNSLRICRKCLMFRENRVGIDLVHDEVERELVKEVEVIQGAQRLLQRTLEESTEQVRRLRSTLYLMDRDYEDKSNVVQVDQHNLMLNEHSQNLSMYHGFTSLDNATISAEEWEENSRGNIERAAKEITSGRSLRVYVDTVLNQVIDDLKDQYNTVNAAFKKRIEETREVKMRLETQHNEIMRQANEVTRKIQKLQELLGSRECFMALAHTRLGNRAQRNAVELTTDLANMQLQKEIVCLRANSTMVQHILTECQASLRYLLKTQIQLEEDINVKTNSLKIDEVDCMGLRESMDYHAY